MNEGRAALSDRWLSVCLLQLSLQGLAPGSSNLCVPWDEEDEVESAIAKMAMAEQPTLSFPLCDVTSVFVYI